MSINLLDFAKNYLSEEIVSKASSFLGESTEATQSGISHALPALLSGVLSKGSSKSGAEGLLAMISKPELGEGLLGNIGNLFGGSDTGLMDLGGSLLGGILGDKLGGITDLIGSVAGFKNNSSSSGLLKMVTPLLMGIIGKKVGNSGISGLMNLLAGQKEHLESASPSGFIDKITSTLGIGSLAGLTDNLKNNAANFASDTANAVKETATNAGNTVKKGGNKFLPILILIALLALAYFAFKNCSGENADKNGVEKVIDKTKEGLNKVTNNVVDGANAIYNAGADLVGKTVKGFENLGEFVKRKLSDGTELIFPSKGFEAKLVDFIESDKAVDKTTWFDMRRVLFKTGSANLDERSMNQIKNVVAILKAYPNVNLKIGGYTDNTGNADFNKTLSTKRAAAVMKAIVDKGINASRLTSEGYGIEHPIADNSTEEGRQLNRRVSARVTKK